MLLDIELYDIIDMMLDFPCFSTLPRQFDTQSQLLYSYGRCALDIIGTFETEQDLYDFVEFCDECKVTSDENGDLSDIFTIWHDVTAVVLNYYTECVGIGTYGWEKYIIGPIRDEN